MNSQLSELNEANFERQVLGAAEVVVVEFWAGWSNACRAMTRTLESAIKDPSVPVKAFRVNTEGNEALTEEYGMRAVPTVLIFKQGSLQDRIVGRATDQEVREKLEHLWSAANERPGTKTRQID